MIQNSTTTGTILKKLGSVMKDVDRIGKDRTNTGQGYKYASEKVIKEVLHVVFVKYGLVLNVSTANPRLMENGAKAVCMVIDMHYRIYDTESGEWIGGQVVGSGNGRDDKGVYAALTGALKYMLTSNFLIPTGDDPESNFFDRYLEEEDTPESSPENKPEKIDVPDAKMEPAPPVIKKPEQDPASIIRLTDDQINGIIAAFEREGIEVWDLEKVHGDHRMWTVADRRTMLIKFNALTDKKNPYSNKDFLEGKLPG